MSSLFTHLLLLGLFLDKIKWKWQLYLVPENFLKCVKVVGFIFAFIGISTKGQSVTECEHRHKDSTCWRIKKFLYIWSSLGGSVLLKEWLYKFSRNDLTSLDLSTELQFLLWVAETEASYWSLRILQASLGCVVPSLWL